MHRNDWSPWGSEILNNRPSSSSNLPNSKGRLHVANSNGRFYPSALSTSSHLYPNSNCINNYQNGGLVAYGLNGQAEYPTVGQVLGVGNRGRSAYARGKMLWKSI